MKYNKYFSFLDIKKGSNIYIESIINEAGDVEPIKKSGVVITPWEPPTKDTSVVEVDGKSILVNYMTDDYILLDDIGKKDFSAMSAIYTDLVSAGVQEDEIDLLSDVIISLNSDDKDKSIKSIKDKLVNKIKDESDLDKRANEILEAVSKINFSNELLTTIVDSWTTKIVDANSFDSLKSWFLSSPYELPLTEDQLNKIKSSVLYADEILDQDVIKILKLDNEESREAAIRELSSKLVAYSNTNKFSATDASQASDSSIISLSDGADKPNEKIITVKSIGVYSVSTALTEDILLISPSDGYTSGFLSVSNALVEAMKLISNTGASPLLIVERSTGKILEMLIKNDAEILIIKSLDNVIQTPDKTPSIVENTNELISNQMDSEVTIYFGGK